MDKYSLKPSPSLKSGSFGTSPGGTTGKLDTNNQIEGVDFKTCDNCKRKIPISVFNTHSATCFRINWYCELCAESFQKREQHQHIEEIHSMIFCDCGDEVERRFLASHQQSECKKRMVKCEFCPLEISYIEKFEHEQKCGSQTTKCDICNKYVAKRDFVLHSVYCKAGSPYNPDPISNNKTNNLFICHLCLTPFLYIDDLQGTTNNLFQ